MTASAGPKPIVIGASGGSGSRLLCRLAIELGVDMGRPLNEALDALAFVPFYEATINPILSTTRRVDYGLQDIASDAREKALAMFQRCLNNHQRYSALWGFKNPRSLLVLPFLETALPGFRFIHLLRDGRDIALSENQNQMRKHFGALLGADQRRSPAVDSARFWAKANREANAWANANLGERYYLLKLETLCAAPNREVARLAKLLNPAADFEEIERLAGLVRPPTSLGRWQRLEPSQRQTLTEASIDGLRTFGYEEIV